MGDDTCALMQITTNTYHLMIGYNHTYIITLGCGGVLSATGWQWGSDGNPNTHYPDETVTATLSADGTYINIVSGVYVGGWPFNSGSPYSWTGGFPVSGGALAATDSTGAVYTGLGYVVNLYKTSDGTYANHGAYVTAMGGGADAAHSCIGMPIVANQ